MKHPARWVAIGVAVVVAVLAVIFATQVSTDPRSDAAVSRLLGKPVPTFHLADLGGQAVTTDSLVGKAVIVNFWNTWCIPCQQELPALKAFYEQHAGDTDFALVGIVRDDTAGAVRAYVRAEGMDWTIVLDPGSTAALAFGTRGQPETFALSANGRVVGSQIGPASAKNLETLLAAARAQ